LFFFSFWVILSGFKTADLVVGALAAVIATSASQRLLPPGQWSFRPVASGADTANQQPAVWVVDPSSHTVSLRKVEVQRFDQASCRFL
jgi:hypothetical protein